MSSHDVKIQRIHSIRKKDKAAVNGYFYSLHRASGDTLQWVCEKRGTCSGGPRGGGNRGKCPGCSRLCPGPGS